MKDVEYRWHIICDEAKLRKPVTNTNKDNIPEWYNKTKFELSMKHMRKNFFR